MHIFSKNKYKIIEICYYRRQETVHNLERSSYGRKLDC